MKRMIGLTAVLAIAGFGCGDDDGMDTIPPIDLGQDMNMVVDGGPMDMPTTPDLGTFCPSGEMCNTSRGCRSANAVCFEPSTFGSGGPVGLGGAEDPIRNHPMGEDTFVETPLFPGGYCTTSWPQAGGGVTPAVCLLSTPEDEETVCGDCATCIDIFGNSGLPEPQNSGFCANNCSPSLDSNECRDGYDCLLTLEVCFLGCQSDDECRIAREEENGIEGLQSPATCEMTPADCTPDDCGTATPADPDACDNPAANYDPLVYDTASSAICDPATSRCTGAPSTPTASGGDACTEDSDCEAEGFCIEEQPIDDEDLTLGNTWLGGSCTKFRCDLPGNECANDGVCQEAGVGVFGCFEGCTVGGYDTTSDPSTWVVDGSAQTTCRDGYGCFWGGAAMGGVADNGVCLPQQYNPTVTTPNIGDPCTEDSECFSPFGTGFCLTGTAFPEGYCSTRNCAAPWFTEGTPAEANACGSDAALCVNLAMDDPTFSLCLESCTTADNCPAGTGCIDLDGMPGGSSVCLTCSTDDQCRDGETCNVDTGVCS